MFSRQCDIVRAPDDDGLTQSRSDAAGDEGTQHVAVARHLQTAFHYPNVPHPLLKQIDQFFFKFGTGYISVGRQSCVKSAILYNRKVYLNVPSSVNYIVVKNGNGTFLTVAQNLVRRFPPAPTTWASR